MCKQIHYHYFLCGCYSREGEFKECWRKKILRRCSWTKDKSKFLDYEECNKENCPRKKRQEEQEKPKTWCEDTLEALESVSP